MFVQWGLILILNVRIALASLASRKMRSFLAMLGIFLGALAFTAVQNISKAMVLKAEQEVEKLGPNLFLARSGRAHMSRDSARFSDSSRSFTLSDARAVAAHVPAYLNTAPFVVRTMPVRALDIKIPTQLVATTHTYPMVRNFHPAWGRFFTEAEVDGLDRVCVLGKAIAERLFKTPEQALGREVLFFRAMVRVIGVMEEKGSDITGTNQDEQVFVPITTYMRRFANQDWITGVYLNLPPGVDQEAAKNDVTMLLRERHAIGPGEDDDFSVMTAKDTIRLQEQALSLVSTLGLISSSISFAVGGLGILSIMVLLVRLRRTEIGIRRALGARKKDIIAQFLAEAGILAGLGGAFGLTAAFGLTVLVSLVGGFPFVFDPVIFLATLFGSAGLGIVSGAYPAWQAAEVEILTTLQSYG